VDLESRLNLEADEATVVEFLAEHGGCLDRDKDQVGVYWLTLHPRRAPGETYFVRLAWQSYPHAAPSVKFSTTVGGRLDVTSAWPRIPGYRPSSLDICKPFTAEGFALHADWRQGAEAWRATGNPFYWVAENLQYDLNLHYEGRSP
jgi:hypothetical protein